MLKPKQVNLATKSSNYSHHVVGLMLVIGLILLTLNITVAAAPLKIMSYNIHHGEGIDGRLDLPGIAALIRETGTDIAGLQEVDQRTYRSMLVDQSAELSRLLDYKYVFTPHFPYSGGNYGLGLVSRYPIVAHKSHPLPTEAGSEAKSMLQATIDVEGTLINVFVIHFEVNNAPLRQAQAEAAAAIAARSPYPALFMGDFNVTPESLVTVPLRHMMLDTHISARFLAPASHMDADAPVQRTYLGGGATFPTKTPTKRADLIWASPEWRPVGTPVLSIASPRSDHTAVVATLELAPEMKPVISLPQEWSSTPVGVVFLPAAAQAWLERTGSKPAEYGDALKSWLTDAGLEANVVTNVAEIPAQSIVVLPGGRFLAEDDAAALKAHVLAGGGLLVWSDAGVETQTNTYQPLAEVLGVEYTGWSTGYPTRSQLWVDQAIVGETGLPPITRFWRMEGPVIRVAPGARTLGQWIDSRGSLPSHPASVNAGLVQNGRTVYLGFSPLQLSDRDNPEVKGLVVNLVRYLATEHLVK
jgi:endonuclease/exonuclease/phosphatase family metal-dependent hydrolase